MSSKPEQSLWKVPPSPERAELRGLCLAHTHLYSGLARGMAIDMGVPERFVDILERLWWKLDVAIDEEILRSSAEVALLDAVECGVSTVIDHHESPNFIDGSLDVLAEAARKIGVRLVACYGSTDRNGVEAAKLGLAENERFAKKCAEQSDGMVAAMVGLHAGFTVSDETFYAHAEKARELDVGFHMHAAEDQADGGAGARLDHHGLLDGRTILAHGVHLTVEERKRVSQSGAVVVHNPRSNQQNAVGYARISDMPGRVALGTDGMDGDLFTELRAAHLAARSEYGPQGGIDAVALLREGAALAERLLGSTADDAVLLDYDPPTPLNADNADGHLLFGIGARHVNRVTVGGQVIVDAGKATRVDAAQIRARAREQAKRLWDRIA